MRKNMFHMGFDVKEFNSLMQFLVQSEEYDLLQKIMKYSTVANYGKDDEYISVLFFGDELVRLCWAFMELLPENNEHDYYAPQVQVIRVRNAAYAERKRAEERAFFESVKKLLIKEPQISRAALARKLNVTTYKVNKILDKVKKEIEDGVVSPPLDESHLSTLREELELLLIQNELSMPDEISELVEPEDGK